MQPEIDIKDCDDDELNRNVFAQKLANSIIEYDFPEPLTIGITGKWGSGKSSLINLTENILKEKDDIIIIRFNPWFLSNQSNLYLQFFNLLISKLKENENKTNASIFERKIKPKRNLFKNSSNSVKNYFNFIKETSLDINLNNIVLPKNTKSLESFNSLEFHKNECENYFRDIGKQIIVIIDDIDRLTTKEIVQIFTLVKSLANFEKFIYVLSFDKMIVTNALKNINSGYNDNFIDKIIQISISVPKISDSKIDELILDHIGEIYDKQLKNNYNYNSEDFKDIKDYLKLFIKDIRDLKRYENMLNFYLSDFFNTLHINDSFLILAIHLFEHELFLKIKENQEQFITKKNTVNYKKNLAMIALNENNIDEKWSYLNELLTYLFPKLNPNNTITAKMYEQWEKEHRICTESYFEKYFTLSLETSEINTTTIEEFITLNEVDEISQILTQSENPDYNHSLLINFRKNISKIPKLNIEFFIKALMKSGDIMNLYSTSRRYFDWIFDELFEKINSPTKCYNILKECIEYFENNTLTVTEYIYSLAFDYGLAGQNTNIKSEEEMFIEKTQVKKLIRFNLDKIHKDCKNKEFLNMEFLKDMLTYWELLENKTIVEKYILNNINSNYEILSFLSKFRTIHRRKYSLNGENPKSEIVFDFKKLDTYHGLAFYENKINEILTITDSNEEKKFCEIFLKQLNEYYQKPK